MSDVETERATDVMVMMPSGGSFHCDNVMFDSGRRTVCGCNVFRKDARGRFICNGCGAAYIGEPADENA